ncbi:MAG TPA: hypothetical protein PLX69_06645 [Leptospiraceae bacterium]|nr:hypothetical protein [Leptospiraceae bacterium]
MNSFYQVIIKIYERIIRKLIIGLCICGILQNCLMIPRDSMIKEILQQDSGIKDKTIFYVSFISNPVLEDTEYIVDSMEKTKIIEEEIENCKCIKNYKVLPLTTGTGKDIHTTLYTEQKSDYNNKVFLEFYINQHSYRSLFNLFYFFDTDKKNKHSIYNFINKESSPLDNFKERISHVLKIQKNEIEEKQQEAKLVEKILKEAFKSNNNKSSKKGGGGAGFVILALVTFVFTVTIHYAQTDVHLNYSHFQDDKLKEKRHFIYTLDTFSHLFLMFKIPWKMPQTHYNEAYKELSAIALKEVKGDNLQISSNADLGELKK